jgi:hypothetical protein
MHDWTKNYTPTQAAAVYNTVKVFMQKMAEVA